MYCTVNLHLARVWATGPQLCFARLRGSEPQNIQGTAQAMLLANPERNSTRFLLANALRTGALLVCDTNL